MIVWFVNSFVTHRWSSVKKTAIVMATIVFYYFGYVLFLYSLILQNWFVVRFYESRDQAKNWIILKIRVSFSVHTSDAYNVHWKNISKMNGSTNITVIVCLVSKFPIKKQSERNQERERDREKSWGWREMWNIHFCQRSFNSMPEEMKLNANRC